MINNKKIILLIFVLGILSCKKESTNEINVIELYKLNQVFIGFPELHDSINILSVDFDKDSIIDFRITTQYETIFIEYDSTYYYKMLAGITLENQLFVPIIGCHVGGGCTVEPEYGGTINDSILDIYPIDYDKCSVEWWNFCYLYKSYDGGYFCEPKYVPIKRIVGDNNYFGWIKFSHTEQIQVEEVFISNCANTSIKAGIY